ncbi:MAG TPA: hypothetical protein VFX60_06380 [Micromonospora sp.]|nr:hypothetical protein [Micromonospora sp.]
MEQTLIAWAGPAETKPFLAYVDSAERKSGLVEKNIHELEQVTPTVTPAELASLLPLLAQQLGEEGIPAETNPGPTHRPDDLLGGLEGDGRFVTFVGAESITREFTATCPSGQPIAGVLTSWARPTTGIVDCALGATAPLAVLAGEYCPSPSENRA